MASGISLRGTPGRCYGFYVDFMECATNQDRKFQTKVVPLMRRMEAQVKALSAKLDENPELKSQVENLRDQIKRPEREDMMQHDDIRDLVESMTSKFKTTATFDPDQINKLRELHESKSKSQKTYDNTAVYEQIHRVVPEMKEINTLANDIWELRKDDKPCFYARDDYFECLHGVKQAMRDTMIIAREQQLKNGGGDAHH